MVATNEEAVESRAKEALHKRLSELGGGCTGNQSSHVCLSDDLRYGLIGQIIYRISSFDSGISISKVVEIESLNTLPPVQWILAYSTDRLILLGSQTPGIEEAVAFCSELESSLGHEIDLTSRWTPNDAIIGCDKCLQIRHAATCWRCTICKSRGPSAQASGSTFDICMRCLQKGSWCSDQSHQLANRKDKDKIIDWRATHALQIVDVGKHQDQVIKTYHTRTLAKSTSKPVLDDLRGVLTWKIDYSHDLTLDLATDELEILITKAIGGNEQAISSSEQQDTTNVQDSETEGTPNIINADNRPLDEMTPLPENGAAAKFDPPEPFCDVCIDMLNTSVLLTDAVLWSQRPLEMVLKQVQGETRDNEPESEVEVSRSDHLELETLPHHISLYSIAESIRHGCLLCSRMWQEMESGDKEEIRDHIRGFMRSDFYSGTDDPQSRTRPSDSIELVVDIKRLSPTTGKFQLHRKDSEVKKDGFPSGPMFGRVAESLQESNQVVRDIGFKQKHGVSKMIVFTGWEKSLVIAQQWLNDCKRLHHCSKSNDWIPTRLVEIGYPSKPQSLRLYVTTEKDKGKHYLTLSHRWGTSGGLRLTQSNIHQLEQGFAASDMPATFRDAVEVCRRLGYRYLWIDSLCIIQDGDGGQDWMRESRLMAEVYRNSDCTIAALFSRDMHSGCFSARNTSGKTPVLFQSCNNVFLIPTGEEEIIGGTGEHNLHSRAWVFQERIFSPRTIGFSTTGIIWDCKEIECEETHPSEDRSKNTSGNSTRVHEMMDQITRRLLPSHIQASDRQHFLKAWFELVYDYSGLGLTFQSDKLIALAGVSQTICLSSGFDYFYGIWHDPSDPEFFLAQLLWHTVEPENIADLEDRAGRPPSFSWTSCNCEVDYPITFHDRIFKDSQLLNVGKSGWINLGDRYMQSLCRHNLILLSAGSKDGNPWDRNIEFRTKLNSLFTPLHGLEPMILLEGPTKQTKLRSYPREEGLVWEYPWDTLVVEDKEDGPQRLRWFFPDATMVMAHLTLLTITRWWRSWDCRWYVAGIALCKKGSIEARDSNGGSEVIDVYSRMGYFEHSWTTQHEHWYDDGDMQKVAIV